MSSIRIDNLNTVTSPRRNNDLIMCCIVFGAPYFINDEFKAELADIIQKLIKSSIIVPILAIAGGSLLVGLALVGILCLVYSRKTPTSPPEIRRVQLPRKVFPKVSCLPQTLPRNDAVETSAIQVTPATACIPCAPSKETGACDLAAPKTLELSTEAHLPFDSLTEQLEQPTTTETNPFIASIAPCEPAPAAPSSPKPLREFYEEEIHRARRRSSLALLTSPAAAPTSSAPPPPPSGGPPPPPPPAGPAAKGPAPEYKLVPVTSTPCNESCIQNSLDITDAEKICQEEIFGSKEIQLEHYGTKKPAAKPKKVEITEEDRRDSGLGVDEGIGKSLEGIDVAAIAKFVCSGPVLTEKQERNFDLIARQLNRPVPAICQAVDHVDEKAISPQIAEALLKSKIDTQQLKKLMKIKETGARAFNKPEIFVVELSLVWSYEKKLQAIFFLHTYEELLNDVERQIAFVVEASFDIERNEDSFKLLFKYATAVAATMNRGRYTAGGWGTSGPVKQGLKIGDVVKLGDVKSNVAAPKPQEGTKMVPLPGMAKPKQQAVQQTNLLAHLLMAAKKNNPNFSLGKRAGEAATVGDLTFKSALKTIDDGLRNLSLLFEEDKNSQVKEKLKILFQAVKEKKEGVLEKLKAAIATFKQVLVRFNEMDEQDLVLPTSPEAFFGTLNELRK